MLFFCSIPNLTPMNHVEDSDQLVQQLRGAVAGRGGQVLRPSFAQQVSGSQKGCRGKVAGLNCSISSLNKLMLKMWLNPLKPYLCQTKVKHSPCKLKDHLLSFTNNLTVVVKKDSTGCLPQPPVQGSDGFQFNPGKILLGEHTSSKRKQQGRSWGTILLHLSSQLQTGKTQELDLMPVKINTTDNQVKVGNRQV